MSNFFPCLSLAPGSSKRNPVGRRWSGADINKILGTSLRPHSHYRMCMLCQGMGDHNGPDVAQQTHVDLLRSVGCMREHETISFSHSVPHGFCWEGNYIDDHLVLNCLPRSQAGLHLPHHRDVQVVDRSTWVYEATPGIAAAPEKRIRYSTCFTAWGTDVNGDTGVVGTPMAKRSAILGVLSCIVSGGFIYR